MQEEINDRTLDCTIQALHVGSPTATESNIKIVMELAGCQFEPYLAAHASIYFHALMQ